MWALPKYGKIIVLILFCIAVVWYLNSGADDPEEADGDGAAKASMGRSVSIDESKNTVKEIPTKSAYVEKLIDEIQAIQQDALALAQ